MKYHYLCLAILICFMLGSCSPALPPQEAVGVQGLAPNEDRGGCIVSAPPPELEYDPFYSKYCNAGGIGIVASEEIDDRALYQAYYLVQNMLAPIPEIRAELAADQHYIAIIGRDQEQTTLPEYAHMDSAYWDARARGLGGGKYNPVTSVGEENLLCLSRWADRYHGENILIHEFAHTIHLGGLGEGTERFNEELGELYYKAYRDGLWDNTYAGSNLLEYWAEGVQTYFNANTESLLEDGVHNYVNTRIELKRFDPGLYAFLNSFFAGFDWTPTCPQ